MKAASEALFKHWNIKSPLRMETSGGSRSTWQLAEGDWLTRCDAAESESFTRETALLELLEQRLSNPPTQLQVPRLRKTTSGSSFAIEQSSLWRLSKNISGITAKASDPRTYPALISALQQLESVLRDVPIESAPITNGVLKNLESLNRSDFNHPITAELFEWLRPRLSHLHQETTITHGDFNPTNIIYEDNRDSLRVVGILDFELSRPDPPIMDYSQLFSMIVCHSGFTDLKTETEKIVSSLDGRFTHEELRLAMLAYWLDLYTRWQTVSAPVEEKIRMRLGQVWNFIQLYS